MIRNQHQITTDQLLGLAGQCQPDPLGEEADGGHRRNGNGQRGEQQAQFAGADFMPEQAPGQRNHDGRSQRLRKSSGGTARPCR